MSITKIDGVPENLITLFNYTADFFEIQPDKLLAIAMLNECSKLGQHLKSLVRMEKELEALEKHFHEYGMWCEKKVKEIENPEA